jgi:16S rRNA G966 N2-methylase RsmD
MKCRLISYNYLNGNLVFIKDGSSKMIFTTPPFNDEQIINQEEYAMMCIYTDMFDVDGDEYIYDSKQSMIDDVTKRVIENNYKVYGKNFFKEI